MAITGDGHDLPQPRAGQPATNARTARRPSLTARLPHPRRTPPLAPVTPALGRPMPVGMRSPFKARLEALSKPGVPDYVLTVAVAMLLLLGLVMVYSASQLVIPNDPSYWLRHQFVWALIGGAALLVTANVDYHFWRRVALPGMALAVGLLLVVLVVGHTVYGAQRWLRLPLFSFQPSELAKLALIIYVGDWLVRKGDSVRTVRSGLLPFAALTGVVLSLILLQNDMGTTIVVAAVALAMFFAAGANPLQLLPTLGVGLLAALAVVARSDFRRARLDAFLHPLPAGCNDAASYQICQGLISLGSGGIFGRGLGDSVQKAGYLPNPFTDSIFAVTGEELGLMGCALILGLFGLIAFRGLRAGRRAPDAYGALLACGITCWLVAQAAVNIGSVVDLIPFTGVPLPFVSFGGSSLVTALAAVGILLNVSRHTTRQSLMPPLPGV